MDFHSLWVHNVALVFPVSPTFSLCLTSFKNGKFTNEVRPRNNTDEHHWFYFEGLVLKRPCF